MTTYEFVTTFSQKGYHCYGQRFVDSFIEHVPHHLVVYHESQPNVDFHHRLTWRNLDHDPDRRKFIEDHGSDPAKVGTTADFNSQSIRFCHKVFALADAVDKSKADWLVWVDGDVVFHGTPRLAQILPDDRMLCYLGRDPALNPQWRFDKKWRPICSETGWVGYQIRDKRVRDMVSDMRSYYTSGEIFTRPKTDWHDAKCFDLCRERSAISDDEWLSYSQGLGGTDVWPRTSLAEFSSHNKGNRKLRAYGSIVP